MTKASLGPVRRACSVCASLSTGLPVEVVDAVGELACDRGQVDRDPELLVEVDVEEGPVAWLKLKMQRQGEAS